MIQIPFPSFPGNDFEILIHIYSKAIQSIVSAYTRQNDGCYERLWRLPQNGQALYYDEHAGYFWPGIDYNNNFTTMLLSANNIFNQHGLKMLWLHKFQKQFRETRNMMVDNMLSTFHALVTHDPNAPLNFREVFKNELFRLSLIQVSPHLVRLSIILHDVIVIASTMGIVKKLK